MLKKHKVVMLSTNQKSHIYYNKQTKGLWNSDTVLYETSDDIIAKHLYIVSDEQIKDKDWFVNDQGVWQCNNGIIPKGLNPRKIIATTDTLNNVLENTPTKYQRTITKLPQPSQSFVEVFVKEYNKSNIITDVLVEYETKIIGYEPGVVGDIDIFGDVLRLHSKENTITIKKVKDSWGREEVIEYMWKAYKESNTIFVDEIALKINFNTWIKQII